MDNIAGQSNCRRGFPAVFSAIRESLPSTDVLKTAVVLCPFGAILAAGAVMLNLKHVKVITADKTANAATFKTGVTDILKDQGIKTSKYDKIVFSGFKNNNATIKVLPAFKVSILADNKITTLMVADGTVADVLKKAGVRLGAEDILNFPANTKVKAGDEITVSRVTYETKVNLVPVSFDTETQETIQLKKGQQKVVSEGNEGQKAITTRVKLIDGKETEETKISENLSVEPVSRKVLVGTASSTPYSSLVPPSGLKLDSNGVPVNYTQCFKGKATAYSSGTKTSTGRHVKVGYVAVDPNLIPYGSKLYIMTPDGSFVYGYAVAADTGDFVHNGSGILTDLYMPSEEDCQSFGVKTISIYVLN